ncbi:MAG: hypothetical protein ABJN84_08915 [Flavobacteriaceae bacterium]
MKVKMRIPILSILLLSMFACGSDNLSNSKAEKVISKCLELKPELRKANLRIGKATFSNKEYDQELLSKYIALTDQGYLEMELLKDITTGWRKGTQEYEVKLSEKALEYMHQIPENGNLAVAKTFAYEVDKVLEVQEIPSMNSATVKVQYKAVDITPFSIFSKKDPKEFLIDDLKMRKTSNGWKYCEDF